MEGLLSTGPMPSSFWIITVHDLRKKNKINIDQGQISNPTNLARGFSTYLTNVVNYPIQKHP